MNEPEWRVQLLKDPYNFLNIARAFRLRNSDFRHTRFDYFSAHPRLLEKFASDSAESKNPFPGSHPVIVCVTELDGIKIQKFLGIRYFNFGPTPVLNISIKGHDFEVPKCCALVLISPEIGTGDRAVDKTAENLIRATASLYFCMFGRENIMDYIGTLYVDSETGFVVSESPDFRNVTIFESFEIGNNKERNEIQERLDKQIGEKKNRIKLAFALFYRAIFENDKTISFVYYWISLEALCNTQNLGVVDLLAKAYGAPRSEIEESTHVREIYQARKDLFHGGQFAGFNPRLFRSIESIFLDLLRYEIGLPCLRHAGRFFDWQKSIPDDPPS